MGEAEKAVFGNVEEILHTNVQFLGTLHKELLEWDTSTSQLGPVFSQAVRRGRSTHTLSPSLLMVKGESVRLLHPLCDQL